MLRKSWTFALAIAGVCLTACQKETLEKESTDTTAKNLNAISFAPTGLGVFDDEESAESRTAYGTGHSQDGKWNCPLYWVYGDEVRIYCAAASSPVRKSADYKIEWEGGSEGEIQSSQSAYLTSSDNNPLCWGDDTPHTFYAFYPASLVKEDNDPQKGIIKGSIPNTQEMEWEKVDGNWVGKPDMKYAFMRAETTVSAENVGKPVTLHFQPLTTAIQVTLEVSASQKESVYLSSFNILAESKDKSKRQAVCGNFTMELSSGEVTLGNDHVNNYQISIDAHDETGAPLEIEPGRSATFTAFLLPGTDENGKRTLENLKIRVPGFGVGKARVRTFEGANIEVGTISRARLTEYTPGKGANNWMEAIDDNAKLSQLSIPGSVNAFSFDLANNQFSYSGAGNSHTDITQAAHVTDQFQAGARAFEIVTNENLQLTAGGINNQGSSYDLFYALQFLGTLAVSNPKECIIAIPSYEPKEYNFNSGIIYNRESPSEWIRNLYQFLTEDGNRNANGKIVLPDGQSVEIKPFDPNMTMEEARGKILLLTRFVGDFNELSMWLTNEGSYTTLLTQTGIVYNWNYDRDKWEKRGYNINSAFLNIAGDDTSRWYWEGETKPTGANYQLDNWKLDGGCGGQNLNTAFYVHEWQRVCPADGSYSLNRYVPAYGESSIYWYGSKNEKINNTISFINDGMQYLNAKSQGIAFINSLGGYYIISGGQTTYGESAAPYPCRLIPSAGLHGDIPPYARDINKAVYDHISTTVQYENRGPLGIMLMDYAGSAKTPFASFYDNVYGDVLMQAVIDNNFRFLLNTGGAE